MAQRDSMTINPHGVHMTTFNKPKSYDDILKLFSLGFTGRDKTAIDDPAEVEKQKELAKMRQPKSTMLSGLGQLNVKTLLGG